MWGFKFSTITKGRLLKTSRLQSTLLASVWCNTLMEVLEIIENQTPPDMLIMALVHMVGPVLTGGKHGVGLDAGFIMGLRIILCNVQVFQIQIHIGFLSSSLL